MAFFRPDPSATGIRLAASAALADGKYILQLQQMHAQEVRGAQIRLLQVSVDHELGQLQIETLADAGGAKRAISVLRKAGYRSVRDVEKRRIAQLSAIRGVGDAGARSVRAASQRIKHSLTEEYRLGLDRQSRGPEADALLASLRNFRRAKEISSSVVGDAQTVLRAMQNGLSASELAEHPWRYLFSARAVKEQLAQDLATLDQYTRSAVDRKSVV